jgi:nucleoid DNA-binding protein
MNIEELHRSVAEEMGVTSLDHIQQVTDTFELAILQGLVAGQRIELEHLGELDVVDGKVRFQPSEFLEQAIQLQHVGKEVPSDTAG